MSEQPPGTGTDLTIETGVCIVGAGPAGLTVARELAARGVPVAVIDSGGRAPDRFADDLNRGQRAGGDYGELATTRQRQIGGTVNLWNTAIDGLPAAKYVPLDAIDLEARDWLSLSGWPLSLAELQPWYARAQVLCGLGRFDYDAPGWLAEGEAVLPLSDQGIRTRVYQFGLARPFLSDAPASLDASPHARLIDHCTVTGLRSTRSGERIVAAELAWHDGRRGSVRAEWFVLAGGAVENARLLLLSTDAHPAGLGNGSGWVGKCFMEHPRDYAMILTPARESFYAEAGFYDQHRTADGTVVLGRLAIDPELLRARRMLQASATLLPVPARPRLATRIQARVKRLTGLQIGRDYPRGGAGWAKVPKPEKHFTGMRLLINLEQAPDPANRVELGTARDALGQPRAVLHWRWQRSDQARLAAVRSVFATALEHAGLGRCLMDHLQRPDPRAHHHAGTTRMSAQPADGVVDPAGRVHDVENLYITGASVMPTAGFANPMLTIVALATRLAAELAAHSRS